MKNTFNVKIVIFLILLIISLVSVTSVFLFDLAPFDGKEQVFIPLIIAMSFTLIRFYNNLMEKSKIVENMKKQREELLNQTTMKFNTCPEYWTKTTKNDKVLCRNFFTDIDEEKMVIGGQLIEASTPLDTLLTTNDTASNIGFSNSYKKIGTSNTFVDIKYTYIPSLRSNIELPKNETPIVEQFSQTDPKVDSVDSVPHMHKRTEILYTPTNSDVKWADGTDREHPGFKDDKHLQMYEYEYVHDHTTNDYYGLDFRKYNLDTDSFEYKSIMGDNLTGKLNRSMYSNDYHWISPYKEGAKLYAEINLDELNKASNKCELVKNLPWVEAKSKCDVVNVRF